MSYDDTLEKIIQRFEEFGFTHEEALNIVDGACSFSEKEFYGLQNLSEEMDKIYEFLKEPINIDEKILDKFNSMGCTSFSLKYNSEIREIFKEDALNDRVEKMECSVEDFKRLGYTDEEAEELYKHINIYI